MPRLNALELTLPNPAGAQISAEKLKAERNRNALSEMVLKEHPEDRAYELRMRSRKDEEYARALKEHAFKHEQDALEYLYKSAPMINYDNYLRSKKHFEDLGLNPNFLPDIETFGEPGSAEARQKFDEWKESGLVSLKKRLDELEISQTITKEKRAQSEEERKQAKEQREKEKFEKEKKGEWKPGGEKPEKTSSQANLYVKSMNQILKEYGASGDEFETDPVTGKISVSLGAQKAYKNMKAKADEGDARARQNLKTYENLKQKLLGLTGESQKIGGGENALSWKNWQNK